ncbi:enoyl-CoA hydratase, partial [Xanthomonas oryzae pv. oryzae]
MSNHVILIADHASIRTITVNRPDKLNALNQQTMQALDQAFQDAAAADDVRAVILTGAGPKAFVAGADIAEMSDLSAIQGRAFSLLGQQLMRRIERMPKPVIAMINGFALGGGLELAMACHLRIAATTARLGQPEINLG